MIRAVKRGRHADDVLDAGTPLAGRPSTVRNRLDRPVGKVAAFYAAKPNGCVGPEHTHDVRSYWPLMRLPDFEQTIKLFGIIGALATFIWGVFVWRDKAIEDRAAIALEQKRVAITRKIEATRPFLEHQLAIYVDAIQTVETIASSQTESEIKTSTDHFWRLYWGELALVEDKDVEAATKRIKKALDDQNGKREPRELEQVSLNLALACRLSLDRSWGQGIWTQNQTAGK